MHRQSLQGLLQIVSTSSGRNRSSEVSAQLSALISSVSLSSRAGATLSRASWPSKAPSPCQLNKGVTDCLPAALGRAASGSRKESAGSLPASSDRLGYVVASPMTSQINHLRPRLASVAGAFPELHRSFHLSATCLYSEGPPLTKLDSGAVEGESGTGVGSEMQAPIADDEGEPVIQSPKRAGLSRFIPSEDEKDPSRSRSPFDGANWTLGNDPRGSSLIEKGRNADEAGVRAEAEAEEEEAGVEGEGEGEGEFVNPATGEHGGPRGPEPTRYGDWERGGRCSDF